MEIKVEKVGDVAVVAPQGEHLIASNVEEFRRDVGAILETNPRVLFDMSALQFVDSSGIGALLSCLRKLSAAGGDMKLFGLSKPVQGVFQITRMHRIFDILGTRADALAAFDEGRDEGKETS